MALNGDMLKALKNCPRLFMQNYKLPQHGNLLSATLLHCLSFQEYLFLCKSNQRRPQRGTLLSANLLLFVFSWMFEVIFTVVS